MVSEFQLSFLRSSSYIMFWNSDISEWFWNISKHLFEISKHLFEISKHLIEISKHLWNISFSDILRNETLKFWNVLRMFRNDSEIHFTRALKWMKFWNDFWNEWNSCTWFWNLSIRLWNDLTISNHFKRWCQKSSSPSVEPIYEIKKSKM